MLITPPYDALANLARQAGRIRASTPPPPGPGLPALWVMSDPARTPDPDRLASGLPAGSALVFRHFGADDRHETLDRLAGICRSRSVLLFVSADPDLERHDGIAGLHWPEHRLHHFRPSRYAARPLMHTASAHSAGAVARAHLAGLDAVFLSPVFASQSPSAGRPLGRFAAAAHTHTGIPLIALGGMTQKTSPRLVGLGLSGLACIGAAIER